MAVLTGSPPQVCYLMPSSSPRCAQFPRAQDKVHFYIKLKELRDQMRGVASGSDVQETRYSFDLQLAKGEAPPTSHTFRLETLRLQRCLRLQRTLRGWPSKRSSTIRSTRAAAGSSGTAPPPERSRGGGSAGQRRYADEGQDGTVPHGGLLPGSFHSCWIVPICRTLLEILGVVMWLT